VGLSSFDPVEPIWLSVLAAVYMATAVDDVATEPGWQQKKKKKKKRNADRRLNDQWIPFPRLYTTKAAEEDGCIIWCIHYFLLGRIIPVYQEERKVVGMEGEPRAAAGWVESMPKLLPSLAQSGPIMRMKTNGFARCAHAVPQFRGGFLYDVCEDDKKTNTMAEVEFLQNPVEMDPSSFPFT
jgi:hypothetical protein